jgi:hypothetical protein
MDYFELIPNDVLAHMFSFCTLESLENLLQVNKRCSNILSLKRLDIVWKGACIDYFLERIFGRCDLMDWWTCREIKRIQKECKRDWKWFSRYLLKSKLEIHLHRVSVYGKMDDKDFNIHIR